ncbi:hypothetical protein C0Q70_02132 [Pomacea canaliculata]|uniref:Uncharacterized protein n=1 Tax=Pomacea canaliculata TaxID=400727 RepID=A0A2T7Q1E6_POMCA|nr:hypothetical protein C0Q70_02132 [Pomacea canaliculata]
MAAKEGGEGKVEWTGKKSYNVSDCPQRSHFLLEIVKSLRAADVHPAIPRDARFHSQKPPHTHIPPPAILDMCLLQYMDRHRRRSSKHPGQEISKVCMNDDRKEAAMTGLHKSHVGRLPVVTVAADVEYVGGGVRITRRLTNESLVTGVAHEGMSRFDVSSSGQRFVEEGCSRRNLCIREQREGGKKNEKRGMEMERERKREIHFVIPAGLTLV